jgi:hypothetical protein
MRAARSCYGLLGVIKLCEAVGAGGARGLATTGTLAADAVYRRSWCCGGGKQTADYTRLRSPEDCNLQGWSSAFSQPWWSRACGSQATLRQLHASAKGQHQAAPADPNQPTYAALLFTPPTVPVVAHESGHGPSLHAQ